jgi:hypothetical protein
MQQLQSEVVDTEILPRLEAETLRRFASTSKANKALAEKHLAHLYLAHHMFLFAQYMQKELADELFRRNWYWPRESVRDYVAYGWEQNATSKFSCVGLSITRSADGELEEDEMKAIVFELNSQTCALTIRLTRWRYGVAIAPAVPIVCVSVVPTLQGNSIQLRYSWTYDETRVTDQEHPCYRKYVRGRLAKVGRYSFYASLDNDDKGLDKLTENCIF